MDRAPERGVPQVLDGAQLQQRLRDPAGQQRHHRDQRHGGEPPDRPRQQPGALRRVERTRGRGEREHEHGEPADPHARGEHVHDVGRQEHGDRVLHARVAAEGRQERQREHRHRDGPRRPQQRDQRPRHDAEPPHGAEAGVEHLPRAAERRLQRAALGDRRLKPERGQRSKRSRDRRREQKPRVPGAAFARRCRAKVAKNGGEVSTLTFSGGEIAPGEFQDFGLSLKMPEGKAGDVLTFKALQTYDDGEVVRWIGPEDSDDPAPTVTLAAGEGGAHAAAATPAAAAPATDDGGDGLSVVAVVVGGVALLAALGAVLRRRPVVVREA